jgi:CheY-like chemotaxis protein
MQPASQRAGAASYSSTPGAITMSYSARSGNAVLEHSAPCRTPTILCIDDDPQVSEVIQDRLEVYDVELLRAFFGAQGIWMAVTNKPDVIITDLRMPQGDGTTVIECLKSNPQAAAIPIIVLTGRKEPGLPGHLERMGVASYLTKPIHFNDLLLELGRYIDIRAKPLQDE